MASAELGAALAGNSGDIAKGAGKAANAGADAVSNSKGLQIALVIGAAAVGYMMLTGTQQVKKVSNNTQHALGSLGGFFGNVGNGVANDTATAASQAGSGTISAMRGIGGAANNGAQQVNNTVNAAGGAANNASHQVNGAVNWAAGGVAHDVNGLGSGLGSAVGGLLGGGGGSGN